MAMKKFSSTPKKKKYIFGNLQSSPTKLNLSVWIFLLKHLFFNDSCAFKALIFFPVLNISFHKLSPSITVELETSESANSRNMLIFQFFQYDLECKELAKLLSVAMLGVDQCN